MRQKRSGAGSRRPDQIPPSTSPNHALVSAWVQRREQQITRARARTHAQSLWTSGRKAQLGSAPLMKARHLYALQFRFSFHWPKRTVAVRQFMSANDREWTKKQMDRLAFVGFCFPRSSLNTGDYNSKRWLRDLKVIRKWITIYYYYYYYCCYHYYYDKWEKPFNSHLDCQFPLQHHEQRILTVLTSPSTLLNKLRFIFFYL